MLKKPRKKIKKKKLRKLPTYKGPVFETYVFWKAMPAIFRGQSDKELQKMGIDGEVAREVLSIKTQTEFSQRYGINQASLTAWNHKLEESDEVGKLSRKFFQKLTTNILGALYKSAVKEGDSARVALWLKFFEGWIEKSETRSPELEKIADVLKNIATKR